MSPQREETLYSIGEAAAVLGVSVQTLRHYSKIGLLEPAYTNPETGYRYYSYIQLSLLDRIRYLQGLGLSLREIKAAYADGHGRALLPYLERQLQEKEEEQKKTQQLIDTLRWYISFFRYPQRQQFPNVPYKRIIGRRYILSEPIPPEEQCPERKGQPMPASIRLRQRKAEPPFEKAIYLRQNGYLADLQRLLRQEWAPLHYFIYLKNDPGFSHPNLQEIPAGEYLCFQGRPLIGQWDASLVRKLFGQLPDQGRPELVVADEYEDSLQDFTNCLYEFHILLRPLDSAEEASLPQEPGQALREEE